jgi:hypothetical protein
MPKTRLTAAGVQKLRLPDRGQVDWFDELLPGFGVRTSYNGSKAWFVMVRVKGKLVRSTLGRFPAISLSDARDLARQVKLEAQAGIDPRARKQDAIAAEEQRHANTFSRLAREFLQTYAEPNLRPSTVREYRRCLLGKDTRSLRSLADIRCFEARRAERSGSHGCPGLQRSCRAHARLPIQVLFLVRGS